LIKSATSRLGVEVDSQEMPVTGVLISDTSLVTIQAAYVNRFKIPPGTAPQYYPNPGGNNYTRTLVPLKGPSTSTDTLLNLYSAELCLTVRDSGAAWMRVGLADGAAVQTPFLVGKNTAYAARACTVRRTNQRRSMFRWFFHFLFPNAVML
jgi:hypothetical protein